MENMMNFYYPDKVTGLSDGFMNSFSLTAYFLQGTKVSVKKISILKVLKLFPDYINLILQLIKN